MLRLLILALSLTLGGGALAQPFTGNEARKMLMPVKKYDFVINENSGLTELQLKYFNVLFKAREYRGDLDRLARYYGAIAISPSLFARLERGELDLSEGAPFQFAEGYHTPEAAAQVAIDDCTAVLKPGEAPCVIAAQLLPKRWKRQPLSLSVLATEAFAQYRKARGPRAFAISRATRAFAVQGGPNAVAEALASCNGIADDVGPPDCYIAIQDSK